jgi:hypothetical protein
MRAMTLSHPISTIALRAVIALMVACQPAILTANRQQPAPVQPALPPVLIASAAPPQFSPVDAGLSTAEELFADQSSEPLDHNPEFSIDPLGSSAAIRDRTKILAVVDGDRVEVVDIPDPLKAVTQSDPRAAPEPWLYVEYFGQWPNDLWAIATGGGQGASLVRWSGGAWHPVTYYLDILWAGLTAKRHALVFLSFNQDCDPTTPEQASAPSCHGIKGFRAFDADGKSAADVPALPSWLAPGAWIFRPEVAALPSGEVVLSRRSGPDLPHKTQHLVVHWTRPQARGTIQWISDPEESLGTVRVQTAGQLHIIVESRGYGYRLEGKAWKQWHQPSGTRGIFADNTLWTATTDGDLWCSLNGDEWHEVPLGLPAAKDRVNVLNVWRGTMTTLYVVVDIGSGSRVFRVRDVTQCQR